MRYVLVACLFSLALSTASAQPTPEPKDGKVTIAVTLTPAAEKKPTSRYLLQPQYGEMQPGDRVGGFLRCFMEQASFFNDENEKKREEWNALPLDKLPLDEIKQHGILNGTAYNPPYASLMVFIDQAARYDRVEWNIRQNLSHDGIYTLLPEVQKLRNLGYVLKLRMRTEIRAGEFAKAMETSKSLFGIARTMEQHPTLIGYLVGVAIASHALSGIEEMIQQPGCPNLYWGLTDLGTPAVNVKTCAQGERLTFLIGNYDRIVYATGPVSEDVFVATFRMIDELLAQDESQPNKRNTNGAASTRFRKLAADPAGVEAARAYLVETGNKPAAVKTFTPLQAVFAADLRRYEAARDDALKLFSLPVWQSIPPAKELDADLKAKRTNGKEILSAELVPAVIHVMRRQAQFDQAVAYLRAIEAIRLHASSNGGKLPLSFSEINLPLPVDPVTGKNFEYKVRNDEVAVLHGANPNPENERTNREYVIRLRK